MPPSLVPGLLLTSRLLLFGVFVVAGLAKLAARSGCRQMLIAFGLPKALARPLGVVLPVAELVIAIALLPQASARFGAIAALSLLAVFVMGIALNLIRGHRPECNCFGQIQSAPIGWSTLGRDLALTAIAGWIAWQGSRNAGPSAVAWVGYLSLGQRVFFAIGTASLLLLLTLVRILFEMLRQQGRLLLRFDAMEARLAPAGNSVPATQIPTAAGLPVGSRAPGFHLNDLLLGEPVTLETLLACKKPALLLFTNPNCGPCQALMPDVARWQREHTAFLTIALVSEGTAEDNRVKNAMYGVSQVLLQQKREVAEAYYASGTPAAVLVQPTGAVGSPVVQGAEAIRALIVRAIAQVPIAPAASGAGAPENGHNKNGSGSLRHPPAAKFGDTAPSLKLRDLAGRAIDLTDFRGHETLLLFWNPGCGFCQRMLNDLKEWDADPPPGAPMLLVVSTGSVKENLAMSLRSRVLLDENFQAGGAFGAYGTPMAVLIDAQGKIASEMAEGAKAIFALSASGASEAPRR